MASHVANKFSKNLNGNVDLLNSSDELIMSFSPSFKASLSPYSASNIVILNGRQLKIEYDSPISSISSLIRSDGTVINVTAYTALQMITELNENFFFENAIDVNNNILVVDYAGPSIPPYTHSSARGDFTATYTSNITLTLAGTPVTVTNEQLVFIEVNNAAGTNYRRYVNGSSGINLSISAGVITITGAGTPFAASDVYNVGLNLFKKAYDISLDILKFIEQSPLSAKCTTPENLIESAQDFTAAWVDLGNEIDMRSYTELLVYLTIDINNSLDCQLQALGKHESAGAAEYNFPIETISASDVKIEPEYLEFNNDSDQLLIIRINTGGVPYVQIQIKAGTVGVTPGQIDAAKINKIWR